MHQTTYEADFVCLKGHKFTAPVSPFEGMTAVALCDECYREWLKENIPHGKQISEPRIKPLFAGWAV